MLKKNSISFIHFIYSLICSLLQTSEKVSTPTLNKSKKKDVRENKADMKWTEKQKDIWKFFTVKCKPVDLHVEEFAVIEIDSE